MHYYLTLPACCRHSWHIRDHLPILKSLRWGEVPFANLRYKTVPWDCGMADFFDCTWEGWWLRPRCASSTQPCFAEAHSKTGLPHTCRKTIEGWLRQSHPITAGISITTVLLLQEATAAQGKGCYTQQQRRICRLVRALTGISLEKSFRIST
jgi:hypothetical protein